MAKKAEFMKVRQHIVDAIATANGAPLRFPPTRQLGEMLSVSQPTALRAVKDLIAEGFLSPIPGGGTVACHSVSYENPITIFGLLLHLGKQSFYNYYFTSITSAIGLEITRRNMNFCTQDIYLESPSRLEKVVKEGSIAALALLDSRDTIAKSALKLRERGLPVVSFLRQFPGISSFYSPASERFAAILKKLFKEGHSRILIFSWPDDYLVQGIQTAIRNTCRDFAVPEGQVIYLYNDQLESRQRVKEMLDFGMKFDAAVFYPFDLEIYTLLRNNPGPKGDCRFVCDDDLAITQNMQYTGYAIELDLRTAARALVNNLMLQMTNPELPPADTHINYKIKFYQEGKEL